MIARLTPSSRFEDAATVFPMRLHNFFTIEELSRPAILTVDVVRVVWAAYMRGWHAQARQTCIRACVAACAALRRSRRIVQRDL